MFAALCKSVSSDTVHQRIRFVTGFKYVLFPGPEPSLKIEKTFIAFPFPKFENTLPESAGALNTFNNKYTQ